MHTGNETLIRDWYERVWNQKRTEYIHQLLWPDMIAHGMGPNGTDLVGPEAFERAQVLFCAAFPDLRITIDTIVSDEHRVGVYLTCRGTHRGDTLGIPATGKTVVFQGMSISRIRDGRIVEGWNLIDFLAVFRQLGVTSVAGLLP